MILGKVSRSICMGISPSRAGLHLLIAGECRHRMPQISTRTIPAIILREFDAELLAEALVWPVSDSPRY